ncbi:MAG: Translation initiation factor 1, partial [uncultured Gemmatimonadaceae bacterium]
GEAGRDRDGRGGRGSAPERDVPRAGERGARRAHHAGRQDAPVPHPRAAGRPGEDRGLAVRPFPRADHLPAQV